MIRFSQRQALLLQLLSEVDLPIKETDLAGLLGVSTRTLRYDIARINGISRDNIIESTTNGYSCICSTLPTPRSMTSCVIAISASPS
ncbi:HTH domain-containing protein [Cutibacterium acnes]